MQLDDLAEMKAVASQVDCQGKRRGRQSWVRKRIGVLSNFGFGWVKKFNLISWYCRETKYDLRD